MRGRGRRAAFELGLDNGAKLRVDTRSSSDRHTLLWDAVRVVTRLVPRLAKALELRRAGPFATARARSSVGEAAILEP